MTNTEAMEFFYKIAEERRYSAKTVKTYGAVIGAYCDYLGDTPMEDATPVFLSSYLKTRGLKAQTEKRYLKLLSDFFDALASEDMDVGNPALHILARNTRTRRGKQPKRLPPALPESEFGRLIESLASLPCSPAGLREKAIIVTLCGTGLRTSELCSLRYENLHLDDHPAYIKLVGKGDKERVVPIPENVVPTLLDYRDVAMRDTGYFFATFNKRSSPYTPSGIYRLVRRAFMRAGIVRPRMSPHVLRHTYATRQLAAGVSLAVVKAWLGHDRITTTALYEHVLAAPNGVRPIF